VGQFEELLQPPPFGEAEQLDIHPAFAAGHEAAQGDDQDIHQFVPFVPIQPR
jgi:hypothetical protein